MSALVVVAAGAGVVLALVVFAVWRTYLPAGPRRREQIRRASLYHYCGDDEVIIDSAAVTFTKQRSGRADQLWLVGRRAIYFYVGASTRRPRSNHRRLRNKLAAEVTVAGADLLDAVGEARIWYRRADHALAVCADYQGRYSTVTRGLAMFAQHPRCEQSGQVPVSLVLVAGLAPRCRRAVVSWWCRRGRRLAPVAALRGRGGGRLGDVELNLGEQAVLQFEGRRVLRQRRGGGQAGNDGLDVVALLRGLSERCSQTGPAGRGGQGGVDSVGQGPPPVVGVPRFAVLRAALGAGAGVGACAAGGVLQALAGSRGGCCGRFGADRVGGGGGGGGDLADEPVVQVARPLVRLVRGERRVRGELRKPLLDVVAGGVGACDRSCEDRPVGVVG
ncbi:MAG TPA: hypothetical protein VGF32_00825, partial [Streptosporangiaceae bacterium]